jgi:hypothetical protein
MLCHFLSMALMFLTMPKSDSDRIRIVEWLGVNGITCYLRSRQVNASAAEVHSGIPVTILVPEVQLQEAQRFLAALPPESDSP